MKITCVFGVLSLALCCFSGVDSSDGGTEVNCDRYLRIVIGNTESIACPSIHKRICATDGKTYANECEICKHNLINKETVGKKYLGKCNEE